MGLAGRFPDEEFQLMPTSQIVDICRHTLLEVLLLAAPILAIAVAVSLISQHRAGADVVAGSHDFSRSRGLLAVAAGTFFMMPWMWRQIGQYTVKLLSDFHPYVQ